MTVPGHFNLDVVSGNEFKVDGVLCRLFRIDFVFLINRRDQIGKAPDGL
jgi:hypothetical protein